MSQLQFIRFYSGSPCVSHYLFCVLDRVGFVHISFPSSTTDLHSPRIGGAWDSGTADNRMTNLFALA